MTDEHAPWPGVSSAELVGHLVKLGYPEEDVRLVIADEILAGRFTVTADKKIKHAEEPQ